MIYRDYGTPRLFLTTNYTNGYRGLRGQFYVRQCGGYFYNPEGEFTSPNYPDNYPSDMYCIWYFKFDWGTRLSVSFAEFNLDPDCSKDYIQLSQGWLRDAPVSRKFCGSQSPPELHSTESEIRVIFKATATQISQAFRKFKMQVRNSGHMCGGLLMHRMGTIESKDYGSRYENNVECVWTIEMPVGFHINFTFVDRFDLEVSTDCTRDYVVFQELLTSESDQWTEFGRYCGHTAPDPFKSRTNKVQVIFHSNEDTNGDGFRLKYQIACGDVFTAPTGVITSPNYPNNYNNHIRCEYLIVRDPKDYITIQFDDFNVEPHTTCIWDAVDIYLGNSTAASHQGTYCGAEKPPVTVSAGALLLIFRSDPSVSDKGFKASYSVSACGGNLTDESGQISSPLHPTAYMRDMDCVWLISVRPNRVIEAKFISIDLQECYKCYCDSVEIRDGINGSAPLIGRYCSEDTHTGSVIKSSDNTLWVRFKTDRYSEKTGFRLGYRTTLGEVQGCGGVFNGTTQGTIQSPDIDGDGKYDLDLNCWYHIIVADDKMVKVTFERMDIEESPANSSRCSYDYLEVRDGLTHQSSLIDRFCGSTLPNPIIGSTNKLVLQFLSDSYGQRTGFKARYEAIDRICGGFLNVTNVSQTIESPNYPNGYPSSLRCRWYLDIDHSISSSYLDNIRLKFLDLDVSCYNNDYIEFSARSNARTRIAPYHMCGTKAPPTISSYNGLFMTFVSNTSPAPNHKGFKLSYTFGSCNQSLTEDSGLIVNQRYPSYQYFSYLCRINITVKVGHTIALYFNDFRIYKPEDRIGCQARNMTIKDGLEADSALLAVLCGSALPNPIFSTGNKVSIEVKSNSYSSKYFISYSSTDAGRGCGGNLTAFNGTFTSPLYPRAYNQSGECKWLVHSFGLHSLTLRFSFFSLSSTIGCQTNYVDVYEGVTDIPMNRVQRLCGDV